MICLQCNDSSKPDITRLLLFLSPFYGINTRQERSNFDILTYRLAAKVASIKSVYLVIDIKYSLLDLLVNLLGGVDERLLHVGRSLCRRFHKY